MSTALGGLAAVRGKAGARTARDRDDWIALALLVLFGLYFLFALVLPVGGMLARSLHDASGQFVGLDNFRAYFASPALAVSLWHSLFTAGATTIIVLLAAFAYAYCLTYTCMRGRIWFKVAAFVPLLTPGLVKAIALVYWFGNQGVLKSWMFGGSIYGPTGIIMASVLWTFPHAVMILATALMLSDARLYESAEALKTRAWRTFRVVTLPAVRYGLASTGIFVFVKVLTDFGIPKVIGGKYSVLATDIYKEVVGQQNFAMGAVVSVVLLVPALLAFVIDRLISSRQAAQLSARSVPHAPRPSTVRDTAALVYCTLVALAMLAVVGMGQFAALVKFWPYNLELTLKHYTFDVEGVGWDNFFNSLKLALIVSTIGAPLALLSAYLVDKPRRDGAARLVLHQMALLPMAVPGLVLGLGYLLFVNDAGGAIGALYGTLALLALSTVTHYYTVIHLTALTALKQTDREFEAVAESLKVSRFKVFLRVTVPVCMPALLEIWAYLFLNSMTTVSAVIFLYGIETKLAAIAVIHLDESGKMASAAAMGMLIVYACVAIRLAHLALSRFVLVRTQRWRSHAAAA